MRRRVAESGRQRRPRAVRAAADQQDLDTGGQDVEAGSESVAPEQFSPA
ncbi:hypothetical protein [Nocardia vulneris]|nr:hypothetical protein [Nocardia vulneris]